MNPVIEVNGLSKAYKNYPGKWSRLREWLSPRGHPRHRLSWVLHGLSFSVAAGESVGIVGQNGAGKSTLLKLLTGTSFPTAGQVRVNGQLSALLELGMGFHPDFTGRQNVYMTGQLMGRTSGQIDGALAGIEAFAEIGDYFDRPVRTYSSGMQVRLAFSVATAFRPDILIVDEALAVGDVYFQHKCFGRIRAFREQGTTLLFVSHDPGAVKSLCDRAILLNGGRIVLDDKPDIVLDHYNALIAEREADHHRANARETPLHLRSGNRKAEINGVVLQHGDEERQIFRVGEAAQLRVRYQVHEQLADLTFGILIKDRLGNDIFGTNTWHLGYSEPLGTQPGHEQELVLNIPSLALGVGSYSVTLALHSHATHLQDSYDWWEKCLVFEVVRGSHPEFIGTSPLVIEPHLSPRN